MYSLFSALTCLIFSFGQRWPMNFTRWNLCLCCVVCGALIFRNSHEVYSRVGDMSRTFKHLFVVINMPTQISHTCFRAGKIFLVKEEQGIPFSTTKIPLMWTHSNNVKHVNVIKPGNQVRGGEKDSTKVYRNVGHKQYTCFKSILFFLII